MNKKYSVVWNLLGLWAFGLIVGSNVQEVLPGSSSSLPAEVMVAIGLIGSAAVFAGLYRALR
jgi:hypothetical protein